MSAGGTKESAVDVVGGAAVADAAVPAAADDVEEESTKITFPSSSSAIASAAPPPSAPAPAPAPAPKEEEEETPSPPPTSKKQVLWHVAKTSDAGAEQREGAAALMTSSSWVGVASSSSSRTTRSTPLRSTSSTATTKPDHALETFMKRNHNRLLRAIDESERRYDLLRRIDDGGHSDDDRLVRRRRVAFRESMEHLAKCWSWYVRKVDVGGRGEGGGVVGGGRGGAVLVGLDAAPRLLCLRSPDGDGGGEGGVASSSSSSSFPARVSSSSATAGHRRSRKEEGNEFNALWPRLERQGWRIETGRHRNKYYFPPGVTKQTGVPRRDYFTSRSQVLSHVATTGEDGEEGAGRRALAAPAAAAEMVAGAEGVAAKGQDSSLLLHEPDSDTKGAALAVKGEEVDETTETAAVATEEMRSTAGKADATTTAVTVTVTKAEPTTALGTDEKPPARRIRSRGRNDDGFVAMWARLAKLGWRMETRRKGSHFYFPPGVTRETGVQGRDYFTSPSQVLRHVETGNGGGEEGGLVSLSLVSASSSHPTPPSTPLRSMPLRSTRASSTTRTPPPSTKPQGSGEHEEASATPTRDLFSSEALPVARFVETPSRRASSRRRAVRTAGSLFALIPDGNERGNIPAETSLGMVDVVDDEAEAAADRHIRSNAETLRRAASLLSKWRRTIQVGDQLSCPFRDEDDETIRRSPYECDDCRFRWVRRCEAIVVQCVDGNEEDEIAVGAGGGGPKEVALSSGRGSGSCDATSGEGGGEEKKTDGCDANGYTCGCAPFQNGRKHALDKGMENDKNKGSTAASASPRKAPAGTVVSRVAVTLGSANRKDLVHTHVLGPNESAIRVAFLGRCNSDSDGPRSHERWFLLRDGDDIDDKEDVLPSETHALSVRALRQAYGCTGSAIEVENARSDDDGCNSKEKESTQRRKKSIGMEASKVIADASSPPKNQRAQKKAVSPASLKRKRNRSASTGGSNQDHDRGVPTGGRSSESKVAAAAVEGGKRGRSRSASATRRGRTKDLSPAGKEKPTRSPSPSKKKRLKCSKSSPKKSASTNAMEMGGSSKGTKRGRSRSTSVVRRVGKKEGGPKENGTTLCKKSRVLKNGVNKRTKKAQPSSSPMRGQRGKKGSESPRRTAGSPKKQASLSPKSRGKKKTAAKSSATKVDSKEEDDSTLASKDSMRKPGSEEKTKGSKGKKAKERTPEDDSLAFTWICTACREAECVTDPDSPLLVCEGRCNRPFHYPCAGLAAVPNVDESWVCSDCVQNRHQCAVCQEYGEDNEDVFCCERKGCGLFFHEACLSMYNVDVEVVEETVVPKERVGFIETSTSTSALVGVKGKAKTTDSRTVDSATNDDISGAAAGATNTIMGSEDQTKRVEKQDELCERVVNSRPRFTCPAHVCWTCTEDTPPPGDKNEAGNDGSTKTGKKTRHRGRKKKRAASASSSFGSKKDPRLFRCLDCPNAYHLTCIPPRCRFHELALLCHEHAYTSKLPDLDAENSIQAAVEANVDRKIELMQKKRQKRTVASRKTVMQSDSDDEYMENKFLPGMRGNTSTMEQEQLHAILWGDKPKSSRLSSELDFCLPCDIQEEVHSKPPAYTHVHGLRYGEIRPKRLPPSNEVCQCIKTPIDGMKSCDEHCLNHMVQVECVGDSSKKLGEKNPYWNCNLGPECGNRGVSRRQFAKCRPKREKGKGWGLVALNGVKRGDLVQEYGGEVIDERTMNDRLEAWSRDHPNDPNFYVMRLQPGWYIDAREKGNLARFINHSCDPNCHLVPINVAGYMRVSIVCTRDVAPGEFLSYDYQFDTKHGEKFVCRCGATKCRGTMKGGKGTPGSDVADGISDGKKTKKQLMSEAKARYDRDKKFLEDVQRSERERLYQVGALVPGENKNGSDTVASGPQGKHRETVLNHRIFLWRNAVLGSDFSARSWRCIDSARKSKSDTPKMNGSFVTLEKIDVLSILRTHPSKN